MNSHTLKRGLGFNWDIRYHPQSCDPVPCFVVAVFFFFAYGITAGFSLSTYLCKKHQNQ